ncbi:LysR family transcriptional regulator [Robbsia sp. Bb-Pol-6]|uniref:LysR family transcriptional regulator n=1 Tax=Robbsia betulipollinis TaxID=2981849 RepID=A0ABT3ZR34_9BURK|nr:LysR family transcriptional regulator [Robbsia betulipollinis]MCY0389011.1 LysR family transcriptional regulator [Robbsia betulipollinis]
MTNRQLRAFLAIADSLSFAVAAERLNLSQPALSLAIKGLETSLGGALFVRSTRNVALSPEGETLLPLARHIIADWDNAVELLHRHFTLRLGKVSIAAMPSYAANRLPLALKVFHDRYPRVTITVHDVVNETMLEMVRNRRVEMGIGFEPAADDALNFAPLSAGRFVAVLPPDSPLATQTRVTWAQLRDTDFITLQRPSSMRALIEERLASAGHGLSVTLECHQLVTVGRMVAAGLGVSAVPTLCVAQMQELGARCVPLTNPVIQRRIGVMHRKDHALSAATQALRTILLEHASGSSDSRHE